MTSSSAEPKLSICIATFNRAAFIGETLERLLAQLTDSVEVVVLDGGSTDATQEIMQRFAVQEPRLRYFREARPCGVDQDFDRAVTLARGEYCWLMADDDLLKPGGMEAVLTALGRDYSLLVVNAEIRNQDMSDLLQASRLELASDRVYAPEEMDRLFAETGSYLTFIGCVVIRRSLWLERRREPYFGSLFIHVGVIFQQRLPGPTCVIAAPLVSIRYGNAMWRPKDFEIWMFKWPGLVWSLAGISDSARRSTTPRDPWRKPLTLLFYRAKGTYSIVEYREWLAPRLPAMRQRLAPLLIALTPGLVANLLGVTYYSLRGPKWRMVLLDLQNSRFHFRRWFTAST
jgi:glycosyltransferase involved in cell wall biosynthesis